MDIGLLKHIIPHFYLYFAKSSLKNYTYNILLVTDLVISVLQLLREDIRKVVDFIKLVKP